MLDVGERRAVELAISTSSSRRSSMSRNDMWQPKQPASEVVAMRTFGLRGAATVRAHGLLRARSASTSR